MKTKTLSRGMDVIKHKSGWWWSSGWGKKNQQLLELDPVTDCNATAATVVLCCWVLGGGIGEAFL